LFNQLTKEQQALWRKEIEQAVISGGYNGLDLARDSRYKENLEVKEVGLIIHTIIAECCDWLAMNTNLSHDEIEGCRNLMLTVKEEQLKAQKGG
jgi:ketopantoate reductase